MALQGDLKTVPLREILGWLAESRASGVLGVSRGMVIRQFHLQRGQVTLSGSTDQEMLLGHLLVERGIVAADQLHEALATRDGSRLRLGTVLARAGLVTPAALRAVLVEKARRLLVDVLSWTDGNFSFDARKAARRSGVVATIGLCEVLALPPQAHLDVAPSAGDVVVTDDDIIEIIELHEPPGPAAHAEARAGARRPKREACGP